MMLLKACLNQFLIQGFLCGLFLLPGVMHGYSKGSSFFFPQPRQMYNQNFSVDSDQPYDSDYADECLDYCSNVYAPISPTVDFRVGYFFFTDSTLNKIYKDGGYDLKLTASYPICNWFELYASVEYLRCSGSSLGAHEKTTIWEVPLSLGLKKTWSFSCNVDYYIAIGPRYFYVHQHNDSSFVDKNLHDEGLGCFIDTGFNYALNCGLYLNVFGQYAYEPARFKSSDENTFSKDADVGGFTFGAGVGYAF